MGRAPIPTMSKRLTTVKSAGDKPLTMLRPECTCNKPDCEPCDSQRREAGDGVIFGMKGRPMLEIEPEGDWLKATNFPEEVAPGIKPKRWSPNVGPKGLGETVYVVFTLRDKDGRRLPWTDDGHYHYHHRKLLAVCRLEQDAQDYCVKNWSGKGEPCACCYEPMELK